MLNIISYSSNDKKLNRLIIPIKLCTILILFIFAINYENAQHVRLIILFSAFAGIIGLVSIRYYFKDKKSMVVISFILEIILIMLLEYKSRFVINYFFHVFYLLTIFEVCLRLDIKPSIYIGSAAILVSTFKYIYLVSSVPNYTNFSHMIFSLMIYTFILIVMLFSRHYFNEKERMNRIYKELLDTHRKLQYYTKKAEHFAIINERTKVARDLHDTLGHMLTGIIMRLEMAEHIFKDNQDAAKAYIEESRKTAREGLATVREIVDTLRTDNDKSPSVMSIEEMATKYSRITGVDIKLMIDSRVNTVNPTIGSVLYSVVKEALTNSVRHGKATRVEVNISQKDESSLVFAVKDNGAGCGYINEGNGLKGMRERIESVNGDISFSSCDGFEVKGRVINYASAKG